MANSTDTYWSIDGVSLQTYGWNITTSGGDLASPPPLRGEDVVIPYVPGALIQPRIPDSRTISFNMWVQGSDSNGKVPTNASMRAEFEKNLKMLRDLFWNGGKSVTLTKRWREYGSSTVITASAKAIFEGGFAPSMTGSLRATFTVDMRLPDPFFYGAEETINLSGASPTSTTVVIKGDYETTDIVITLNGSRYTPRLTVGSAWVQVDRDITSGNSIVLDVDAWTAIQNPEGSSTNVIRYVTYSGNLKWFSLSPGSRTITLSNSSSGTTTSTIKYRPKYI